VADDDEFFRVAVRTILTTQFGFGELVETASFDEAWDRLSERQDVGLALFDLQMLGREGARRLRITQLRTTVSVHFGKRLHGAAIRRPTTGRLSQCFSPTYAV
jgi:DNA-binding NarL/FixJ family response regulator